MLPNTKNNTSQVVPLTTKARDALQRLDQGQKGRIFRHSGEDPLKKAWYNALNRARANYVDYCANRHLQPDDHFLVNFRFHDIRHQAGTRLAKILNSLFELSVVTGHKSVKMLTRYVHPDQKEIAQKLP